MRALSKLALMLGRLDLDAEERAFWFTGAAAWNVAGATGVDDGPASFGFEAFLHLVRLFAERGRIPGTTPSFVAVLASTSLGSFATTLSERTGWTEEDIAAISLQPGADPSSVDGLRGSRSRPTLRKSSSARSSARSTSGGRALDRLADLDRDSVVRCFRAYMNAGDTPVSRAEFEQNLAAKRTDPAFLGDVGALLALDAAVWNPDQALDRVLTELIAPARRPVGRRGGRTSAVDEPLVIFVDIDDTLVRSFGSKRIAMSSMVDSVRALHSEGAVLYAWSSGGADYARSSAEELGIGGCFVAFLPKPDVFIDDVRIEAWRNVVQVHPNQAVHRTLEELRTLTVAPR